MKVALILVSLFSAVSCEDTFASTAHLRIVANGEVRMRKSLKDYIDYEAQRLKDLNSFVATIRKIHSSPGANDTLDYVGNPLNALHLIKRFATKWREIWEKLGDFSHYEALRKQTEEFGFFLPVEEDYEGAKHSVLRLQEVYKIKAKEFARGVVAGKRAQPMSQKALFDIGMICMGKKDYRTAIDWLKAAVEQKNSPLANPAKIHSATSDAYLKLGQFEKSGSAAEAALSHNPTNVTLQKRAAHAIMGEFDLMQEEDEEEEGADVPPVPSWYMAYQRLCREGFKLRTKSNATHNAKPMRCFYRSVSLPYMRFKIEPLSRSPKIEIVHEFVKSKESKALIARATYMMVRAKVGHSEQAQVTNDRIGKVAWLWEQFNMSSITKINSRISRVTRLNVTFPHGEPLQVVNYGIGGQYEPHNDHDEKRMQRTKLPVELALNGDRMATFMVYLSEVSAGGATVFPHLDLFINPIKNAAVLWYNYKHSGEPETQLLHAGCPVIVGEKWIVNKWIRERGQEFRRPCRPMKTKRS